MTPMVSVTCSSLAPVLWEPSPGSTLTDGVVQVWRASLRQQKAAWDNCFQELLPEEKQRALRFFRPDDRNRFLLGRKMLRTIIGRASQILPETVAFSTGVGGKLFFVSRDERPLSFNLSHSGDWVTATLGIADTGVDVEAINVAIGFEELAAACFSPEEQKVLRKESNPLQTFYTFWTRKEALLKATGIGLIDELTHFSCIDGVNKTSGETIKSLQDWLVQSFQLDKGHMVSVASPPGVELKYYDFDSFENRWC